MLKYGLSIGLLLNAALTMGAELAGIKQELKPIIQSFAKDLQSELINAVKTGGPVSGIHVCQVQAPSITNKHSQSEWQVARTSLKYRNSHNAPDQWETTQLLKFDEALKQGQDPQTMWAIHEDEKQIRVMKAIPTKAICLTCHGQNITPEIRNKLHALYPNDLATGYQEGQIRGAFSLMKVKTSDKN